MSRFQKWAIATLVATLLLIFIGGFVRVSGAGLGCPDWPKCWGSWWPPNSVLEIDASKYPVDEFNHTKMWIEYGNRIVGMVVGMLVVGTFLLSLRSWKRDRLLVVAAGVAVLMVGFEGWLGGKVVESGLAGGMVSIHLGGAVVLFSLLIWITWRSGGRMGIFEISSNVWRARLRHLGWAVFLCSAIQMILGARVREELDLIAKSGAEVARSEWLEMAGDVFLTHRSFSWVLCGLAVLAIQWIRRSEVRGLGRTVAWSVPSLVGLQIGTGVALAYFAIPGWAQVLHLGLSAVLCCVSFWLILGFGSFRGGEPDEG